MQRENAQKHGVMLSYLIKSLNIVSRQTPSETNQEPRLFNKSNTFDFLDTYLRPRTQWDPSELKGARDSPYNGGKKIIPDILLNDHVRSNGARGQNYDVPLKDYPDMEISEI